MSEHLSHALLPFVEEGHYDSIPKRGVVMVGLNEGRELPWFLDRDIQPILAFEPNPAAFRRAVARWAGDPRITIAGCGLGATNGTLTMHVPEDGDDEKTSRYVPIPTEGHDWTKVPVGQTLEVDVMRFDHWVKLVDYPFMGNTGTLVIDAQGMELEVLVGMGEYLQGFLYLCIEMSAKPVYLGEASAEAVCDYLAKFGFHRRSEVVEHGDVLFAR